MENFRSPGTKVPGTFVPETFRSRELSFSGNESSLELSFRGPFRSRELSFAENESSWELSFPGKESSRERKVSGTKVPHRDYSFLGTKGLGHEKSWYQTSNAVQWSSRLQRCKWATIIHTTNSQCVLYIKAGAVTMAGAWFIHWPLRPMRGLYGLTQRKLHFRPETLRTQDTSAAPRRVRNVQTVRHWCGAEVSIRQFGTRAISRAELWRCLQLDQFLTCDLSKNERSDALYRCERWAVITGRPGVTLSYSRCFKPCLEQRNSSLLDVKSNYFALNWAVWQTSIICVADIARQQLQPEQGLDVNCVTNN